MTRNRRRGDSLRDDTRGPAAGDAAIPNGFGKSPEPAAPPADEHGPGEPGAQPGYGGEWTEPGSGPADPYGSQQPYASQQGYPPQDPYAPQDPYPAHDPYGSRDPYAPPEPYPPPAPGLVQEPYAEPDPYGSRAPHTGPDGYAQPAAFGAPGTAGPPEQRGRPGAYDRHDPFGGRDPLDPSVPYVPMDSYDQLQSQRQNIPHDQRSPHGEADPYGQPDPLGGRDAYGQPDPPGGRDAYGQPDPPGGQDAYGQPDPPGGGDPYGQTDPHGGPDPYRRDSMPGRGHDPYGQPGRYGSADPYGSTAQYLPSPDPGSYPSGMPGTDPAADPAAAQSGGPFRWLPPAGLPGPEQQAAAGHADDRADYLRGERRSGAAQPGQGDPLGPGPAGHGAGEYRPGEHDQAGYGPPGYGPPGYGQPGGLDPLVQDQGGAGPAGYGGESYPAAWTPGSDGSNGAGYGTGPGPRYPGHSDPRYPAGGDPRYLAAGDARFAVGDPRFPPGQPGYPDRGGRRQPADEPPGRPARGPGRPGGSGPDNKSGPGRKAARGPGRDARPGAGRLPKKRRSGTIAGLVATIVIVIVLAAGGLFGYRYVEARLHPANFSGDGHGTVTVQVQPGDSAITLAPRLLRLGVIASTAAFISAVKASSNPDGLQPGTFRLHKAMNAALAYQLLLNPKARIQSTVTIPEGLRQTQIVATLGRNTRFKPVAYNEVLRDPKALGLPSFAHGNPEGYLFPATYQIQPGMTAFQVLQGMVQQFNKEAQIINLAGAAVKGHVSESHAIIVASLIQAEAGKTSDFPKIAEVIYNRLNSGMKLQLDSTVFYALGTFGIQATSQDLKTNSPYNTYRQAGLPPTPIDSPGAAAIKAALHPEHGNWLYFVTVDPKKHITKFTASVTQFEQFRAELARNLANRT